MTVAPVETPRSDAVPRRVLSALRRAGASEAEIRRKYHLAPDEAIPDDLDEPLRVEDLDWLPKDSYRYELWEGKLLRRKASKPRHSVTAGRVVRRLSNYLDQHEIGELFVADGGFRSGPGESLYCPDASYVSNERMATISLDEFTPFAPDIAVEVRSPDNTQRQLEVKARYYLEHGAQLVWVLNPRPRTARVYRPGAAVQLLRADDLLSGEAVLPGFSVRVGDLFP